MEHRQDDGVLVLDLAAHDLLADLGDVLGVGHVGVEMVTQAPLWRVATLRAVGHIGAWLGVRVGVRGRGRNRGRVRGRVRCVI